VRSHLNGRKWYVIAICRHGRCDACGRTRCDGAPDWEK
jgi:hypothetical protein